MQAASLHILNASAGAGKTYSLVRNYLFHCFSSNTPDYFRHILAITFTNKAAHEMKERVLDTLVALSENNPEEVDMGRDFLRDLQLSPAALQLRARNMLKRMLHEYALLSISTIDHFNHRLIRTFAMELELANNFNLELDSDYVFNSVADLAIDQLGEDDFLTDTVLSFVEQQLQSDKSWRIKRTLVNVARLMLREDSIAPVEALKSLSDADLKNYREDLTAYQKEVQQQIVALGKAGLKAVGTVPHKAFRYGAVPSYFEKLANGDLVEMGTRVLDSVRHNKWFSGNNDPYNILDSAPELAQIAETAEATVQEHLSQYLMVGLILRDFHGLSLLKKLDGIYTAFKTAENLLPIGEFNRLISKEVSEQPTPFIYERIGERYLHYFIDEFQDTSLMQWGNLRPLIRHAVGSGGSALLVGDPKQAIYRWRGGEVQQFVDLTHNRDVVNKVVVHDQLRETFSIAQAPLADNWRSRYEVVDFNNRLYGHLAEQFSNSDNKEIYAAAQQNPKKGTGGMVVLRKLPGKHSEAFVTEALNCAYQTITSLLEEGFSKSDITILVRRNGEGRTLVLDFANRPVPLPVISSESLTLSESAHAAFLAALAGMLVAPGDKEFRFEVLTYLMRYQNINGTEEEHAFLDRHIRQKPVEFQHTWKQWFPNWHAGSLMTLSPVELLETFMRILGMANNPDAFTQKLLNMAHEVASSKDNSINAFLEQWQERAAKISVSPPDDMDALRVMTVHKSKGLQFPVVMVPFGDWSITPNNDEKVWVPLTEGPLAYAHLPVTSAAASTIGGAFAELSAAAKEATKFDAMNMLYVATTRAEHRLYLFTRMESKANDISAWLDEIWTAFDMGAGDSWQYGAPTLPLPKKRVSNTGLAPSYAVRDGGATGLMVGRQAPRLRFNNNQQARNRGKMLHAALEHAQNRGEVAAAVAKLVLEGHLPQLEVPEVVKGCEAVFDFPPFKAVLEQTAQQFSERAIITSTNGNRRPDRLLHLHNGCWVVVDFKTGQPEASHKAQVRLYCDLLLDAGCENVAGYLLYLGGADLIWEGC